MNNALKWVGAISAIVLGCGGGAFAYLQYSSQLSRDIGRIEAENNYIKDQFAELRQQNVRLIADAKESAVAYRKKEEEVALAKSNLASIQNDECNDIWRETLSLENDLHRASYTDSSPERREDLRNEISEHKKTHQVCLASRH